MNNKLNIKQFLYAIFLFLILPNFIFVLVAYWTGDTRSIINIDYLLPLLCFFIKNRFIKIIGLLFFILIFIMDLLLLTLQHFPSLRFQDCFYLITLIFSGPKIFLLYGVLILLIALSEIIILWKYTKKTNLANLLALLLLLTLTNIVYYFTERDNTLDTIQIYHTPFISSNSVYFIQNQQKTFSTLLGGDYLNPTPYQHATNVWTKAIQNNEPLNNKLLLIINESWGAPLNKAIQNDIISTLKAKADYFDFFEQGEFSFRGFTVEGELRELCQLYPSTLNLYKINTGFQNCLPHKLNKLGYQTIATQGWLGTYYGAKHWYPQAGFSKRIFQENLDIDSDCIPFKSICDWDMFSVIKKNFATHDKVFNYWLTITPHYPYFKHDIHNIRFNCNTYNLPNEGEACRSFMLQAQLFDYLAELVTSPEMKGVEVIIVGDHPPPLFKADEIALFKTKKMRDAKVSWLHFKLKN